MSFYPWLGGRFGLAQPCLHVADGKCKCRCRGTWPDKCEQCSICDFPPLYGKSSFIFTVTVSSRFFVFSTTFSSPPIARSLSFSQTIGFSFLFLFVFTALSSYCCALLLTTFTLFRWPLGTLSSLLVLSQLSYSTLVLIILSSYYSSATFSL